MPRRPGPAAFFIQAGRHWRARVAVRTASGAFRRNAGAPRGMRS